MEEFTILENKAIGRNISFYRNARGMKTAEIADHLGITESTYSRYERGETKITIGFIQKVSEFLKVDPLALLSMSPGHVIENNNNSVALINSSNHQTIDQKHLNLLTKLIENVLEMNDRVLKLLEESKNKS